MRDETYLATLLQALKRHMDDPDYEWADVADAMSAISNETVSRDTIRRNSPVALDFIEAGWVRRPDNCNEDKSGNASLEANKALIKLCDERREIARIQRELARNESVMDMVREAIQKNIAPLDRFVPHEVDPSDNDVIVHLTDLHDGLNISNWCNAYDSSVLEERLNSYIDQIAVIAKRHEAENCHVLLGGDLISGYIHSTLRAENNMDVLSQLRHVSQCIAVFVEALSDIFGQVNVYSVPGNHSRLSVKKEDSIAGENLDLLVPYFLQAYLRGYENVAIHTENIQESIAVFMVRGLRVCGVHGDKDTPETVVQKLTMFLGHQPDIILMGHRHTNGMRTVYNTKVIESGSVSGADAFCLDHRLRNRAEQTVLVVNDAGLACLYNVDLQ